MVTASEIFGQRERPYDMRWGTPEQVKESFGINVTTLKASWKRGWVRARQGNWESDGKRTQTVYCFEDIHGWLERAAHKVSDAYAAAWWTDETVAALEEKMPDGPYLRGLRRDPAPTRRAQNPELGAPHPVKARKDGFAPLSRKI